MSLTQSEALSLVSLESMRSELRIPDGSHDKILTEQITSAANFVAEATGREAADLLPLRASIVSLTRSLYDGHRELSPDSAVFGLMDVFRSYKHSE